MDTSKTNYKQINKTIDITCKDVLYPNLPKLGEITFKTISPFEYAFNYVANGYGKEIFYAGGTITDPLYKVLLDLKQCPNMYMNDIAIYNSIGINIVNEFEEIINKNINISTYVNSPLLYTLNENKQTMNLVLLDDGLKSTYGSLQVKIKQIEGSGASFNVRICSGNKAITLEDVVIDDIIRVVEEAIKDRINNYINNLHVIHRNDTDTLDKKLYNLPDPENIRVYFTPNACGKSSYNFINPVNQEVLRKDMLSIKSALVFEGWKKPYELIKSYMVNSNNVFTFDAIIADELPFLV